MPSALPMAIRHEIVRRRLDGQELVQVARELGLSYHSVRQIWRTFRQRGHEGLNPRYPNCGRRPADAEMVARACVLKKDHPRWGAKVVRIELARALGRAVEDLPAARTLQVAFRAPQVSAPRRPKRPPSEPAPRATRLHEVWQVDAVEKATLRDGRLASWLTVVDEATGALLDAELSPPGTVAGDHRRSGPRPVSPGL
jgi:hypothetical protein